MNNDPLHDLIRESFEGRNAARLLFTLAEVSHAWRNLFREPIKKRFSDGIAKPASLALSVLGALFILAAVGGVAMFLLTGLI